MVLKDGTKSSTFLFVFCDGIMSYLRCRSWGEVHELLNQTAEDSEAIDAGIVAGAAKPSLPL
ncbi:MAG: hypothetical protein OXC31_11380 [Spirochaetaceae bacterium]|nr:hypothetical protein [Spirochaetaceae bacterium]